MIKYDIFLIRNRKVTPLDIVPNTINIGDFVTDLQITYSLKQPYEQASIKARIPLNQLAFLTGKPISAYPNNPDRVETLDLIGADGWVYIYERNEETKIIELKFFGLMQSMTTNISLNEQGVKSTSDLSIQCTGWISVLNTPIKLTTQDYYDTKGIKTTAGLIGDVNFYEKLGSLLQNFLDPKTALKELISLFGRFFPQADTQITNFANIPILTTLEDLDKNGVTSRSLKEIVTYNFDTLLPSMNGALFSFIYSSLVGEFDGIIELFESLEYTNFENDFFNQLKSVYTSELVTEYSFKQVTPCLIYRYKPLPPSNRLTKGGIISETKSDLDVQAKEEIKNDRSGQAYELITFESIVVNPSIEFTEIKGTRTKSPVIVETLTSVSFSWQASNRINLVNVNTKASGVNGILGLTTDFYVDAPSVNEFGVYAFDATYPFFGTSTENENIRKSAGELREYVRSLIGDGEYFGNASCQSYYEPSIKQGEYVLLKIVDNKTPLTESWFIGYCTQVSHSHRALPDGRVTRSTSFSLERVQLYAK